MYKRHHNIPKIYHKQSFHNIESHFSGERVRVTEVNPEIKYTHRTPSLNTDKLIKTNERLRVICLFVCQVDEPLYNLESPAQNVLETQQMSLDCVIAQT